MGVTLSPIELPQAVAASYPAADGRGLILTGIAPASPAERAGLIPGDVILAVDGAAGLQGLAGRLRSLHAGRPIRLWLLRGGQQMEVEAVPALAA